MAIACIAMKSGDIPGPKPKVRAVLYAVRDIPAGTLLTNPEELFRPGLPIDGNKPVNGIKDYHELKGKVLTRKLLKGEACTASQLLALPRGRQPLTLTLDVSSRNCGAVVTPGGNWDVIGTVHLVNGPRSQIVGQDLLLLATEPPDDGVIPSLRATFAVTAEEGKKLLQSQGTDTLHPVACPCDGSSGR
jgi:hypothetical protein